MTKKLITVIIATFNSEKTLPLTLKSIEKQTFSRNKIEILVMDGGSTDKTLEIARKFRCIIINNPQTEPVYGKFLGYNAAKGRYIMYLDSDEVLENKKSLELKLSAFHADKQVKMVAGGGFKSPQGYPVINDYINEFGDPFSFFIYRLPKDPRFFIPTMKKHYRVFKENGHYAIFDLSNVSVLPIFELVGGASMFDKEFMQKKFPLTKKNKELLPHFFYLICSQYPFIAITKNDALIHYSATKLHMYLKKIDWRIINNIYFSGMGKSGFSGRNKYQPQFVQFKKYLFIPYALTIVFPLIDAFFLSISRKNILYFIHIPLSFYTAVVVIYHYCLKLLGFKPKLKSYGGAKVIST